MFSMFSKCFDNNLQFIYIQPITVVSITTWMSYFTVMDQKTLIRSLTGNLFFLTQSYVHPFIESLSFSLFSLSAYEF